MSNYGFVGEAEIKKIIVHTGDGCNVYWAGPDSEISEIKEKQNTRGNVFHLLKEKDGKKYLYKEIINMPVELTYREPR